MRPREAAWRGAMSGRRPGSAGTSTRPKIASLSRRSAASVASIRSGCRPVAQSCRRVRQVRCRRQFAAPPTITENAGRTAFATRGTTRPPGEKPSRPTACARPAAARTRAIAAIVSFAPIKHGVAQGRIDGSLKPDLVATWLPAPAEGAVGRVVFEPGFKPRAHRAMLRTIVQRMLRPQ